VLSGIIGYGTRINAFAVLAGQGRARRTEEAQRGFGWGKELDEAKEIEFGKIENLSEREAPGKTINRAERSKEAIQTCCVKYVD
jgi:hypothetical protein